MFVQHEVEFDIREHGDDQKNRAVYGSYGAIVFSDSLPLMLIHLPTGELPVPRAAVLKHTLRSLHRMMQSSGTAEGLRGLIDSSILKSLKLMIEHRGLFGPSLVPIGQYLCESASDHLSHFICSGEHYGNIYSQ